MTFLQKHLGAPLSSSTTFLESIDDSNQNLSFNAIPFVLNTNGKSHKINTERYNKLHAHLNKTLALFVNNNLKIETHTETQVGDRKRPDVDFIINNRDIYIDTTTINSAADKHITEQKKNVNQYSKMPLHQFIRDFDPLTLTEKREGEKKNKYDSIVEKIYDADSLIQAEFYPLVITYDGIFGAHTELLFERMKKLMNNCGYNMNSTYVKSLLQSTLFARIYMIRHPSSR